MTDLKTLSVGCGGNKLFNTKTIKSVNLDIRIPIININNFVLSSVEHIPFRKKSFEISYAFNVLEHIFFPRVAISQLSFVSKKVFIRQDSFFTPSNFLHQDHKYFTFHKWFIPLNSRIGRIAKAIQNIRFVRAVLWKIARLHRYNNKTYCQRRRLSENDSRTPRYARGKI